MMRKLSEHEELGLAIHGYAFDSETAGALHRIDGILELVDFAMTDLSIGDPVPNGVESALLAAHDILWALMVRGGIKGADE